MDGQAAVSEGLSHRPHSRRLPLPQSVLCHDGFLGEIMIMLTMHCDECGVQRVKWRIEDVFFCSEGCAAAWGYTAHH